MLPYISIPFIWLGSKIGAEPDELKLLFSFLVSYPLAAVLKRLPDDKPEQKTLFSVGVGLFYLVGLFDLWDGLWTLVTSAMGAYAIAYFMRGSPYMPWTGFVFVMGHMSISHIARQAANSSGVVDISGAQMVMVIKLSAFCWNVADGVLPDDQLSDLQRDRRLLQLPSLFDYAGYVFFFPSLLIGPAFDFAEYRRWLDSSMFDVPASTDPAKKAPTRKKRRTPRSGTAALWKLGAGLAWVFAFLQLGKFFSADVLLGPTYMKYGLVRRIFILHMVGLTARLKYYGVWTLTEGACILTGLGYNGIDPVTGVVKWDRLQNINAWGVETAQNTRAYLGNWNMNTNNWLRNYIYLRVTPRGKKPGFRASLATFTTSAFWHGFYPGYYLTFMLASFVQTVSKNFRKYLRPFFLDPTTQAPLPSKRYYDFFTFLVTQVTFSFVVAPFLLLSFKGSLLVWARVYFYAIIGTAISAAAFAVPDVKKTLRSQLEARAAKPGPTGDAKQSDSLTKTASWDSHADHPFIGPGLSSDPQREFDEAFNELRADFRDRRLAAAAEADINAKLAAAAQKEKI